ncbi:TraY domain-containing protein [Legionella impletisoli]|uniref:Relaxosome protein TraY n=1 Tax=Legionella impletisoli TaxID=343510 RepID=A0A917JX32_9GAMM|nr:TraY domain-containing protein [Legionella impletisoli]GGI90887.1 hypothetical protein GCM10007966_19470 [Legionella impletisoli]
MEFDNKKNYKDIFVTIKLSAEGNKLLTESCKRAHRKKLQEATLRLEDHLMRFRSISEKGETVTNKNGDKDNSIFIEKNTVY